MLDYSEEKTIEKLQQFVNDVVAPQPSTAVCLRSVVHVDLLFISLLISENFHDTKYCSQKISKLRCVRIRRNATNIKKSRVSLHYADYAYLYVRHSLREELS